jgi:site-specific DNA-adenine methylase
MPRQLFPYIGGKYTIAPEINRRFGAINTRIDAFAGSSSWVLASEPVRYEIVNDLDGYVVNYLRADQVRAGRGCSASRLPARRTGVR